MRHAKNGFIYFSSKEKVKPKYTNHNTSMTVMYIKAIDEDIKTINNNVLELERKIKENNMMFKLLETLLVVSVMSSIIGIVGLDIGFILSLVVYGITLLLFTKLRKVYINYKVK